MFSPGKKTSSKFQKEFEEISHLLEGAERNFAEAENSLNNPTASRVANRRRTTFHAGGDSSPDVSEGYVGPDTIVEGDGEMHVTTDVNGDSGPFSPLALTPMSKRTNRPTTSNSLPISFQK